MTKPSVGDATSVRIVRSVSFVMVTGTFCSNALHVSRRAGSAILTCTGYALLGGRGAASACACGAPASVGCAAASVTSGALTRRAGPTPASPPRGAIAYGGALPSGEKPNDAVTVAPGASAPSAVAV